ncbi:MAG: hypothetical protein ACRDXX_12575 [Stackebrandtia sp.]
MKASQQHEIEYGRFSGPHRTYVVTNCTSPDTIRVYAGEPAESEMVCTISNISIRPIPAWSAKYQVNMSNWKRSFADEAVRIYRVSQHSHAEAGLRYCEG